MTRRPLRVQHDPPFRFEAPIPLGLYIHFPWCVRKCPYCDFNSHPVRGDLPEEAYLKRLVADAESALPLVWGRPLQSIFMGGGTPSLISPDGIAWLLSELRARFAIGPETEITLEANPGTLESDAFAGYREGGVNRLSIGVQSFDPTQLEKLGRIHSQEEAFKAVERAKAAGFERINVDLMFALPEQRLDDALLDLQTGIDLGTEHLSWYQLTLEPHTPFYHTPPLLPDDDATFSMMEAGCALLEQSGFSRYEVSAYTRNRRCVHNQNYWEYGDYLGIGAGAHSKLTQVNTGEILRQARHKHPKTYLNHEDWIQERWTVTAKQRPFEFMLNALRLRDPTSFRRFEERTGMAAQVLLPALETAQNRGWVTMDDVGFQVTEAGYRFVDEIVMLFL